MFFAREISRGAFLNARFGVNGTQNASRSLGTIGASGRVASDMNSLLHHGAAAKIKQSVYISLGNAKRSPFGRRNWRRSGGASAKPRDRISRPTIWIC